MIKHTTIDMYAVLFVTASNGKEAKKIANALIGKKLAACVNIIDRIKSIFWWQNKIDKCSETLLIIKTKKKLIKDVIKTVKKLHSYDVPEIIALPIISGEKQYLRWVYESTM